MSEMILLTMRSGKVSGVVTRNGWRWRDMTYNRGMVRDLLDNQDSLTTTVLVGPNTVEEFTKDRVEGLINESVYFSLHSDAQDRKLTFFSDPIFSFRVYPVSSPSVRHCLSS